MVERGKWENVVLTHSPVFEGGRLELPLLDIIIVYDMFICSAEVQSKAFILWVGISTSLL
jgi:hypothetical protein